MPELYAPAQVQRSACVRRPSQHKTSTNSSCRLFHSPAAHFKLPLSIIRIRNRENEPLGIWSDLYANRRNTKMQHLLSTVKLVIFLPELPVTHIHLVQELWK